ncbi:zinc finger protein GLIS2 isoform X1 [Xenopus laevis]|uniref:Zinc finger protein GLIS2 n=2 Tax=Xenopus laevis TaxID=8355 RepID=A0A8J1LW77_XENLA|nr:zinc finger protein GLIS2 isoform X1 [Xenopus laevis]
MHSLDEPLDLKLSISKLRAAREKRERIGANARKRSVHHELMIRDDGTTVITPICSSPPPGFRYRDGDSPPFSSPPIVDLSLSPPSGTDSPSRSSLSPDRAAGDTLNDNPLLRCGGDSASSPFQFFLPLGSGLQLPPSMFMSPPKENRLSLEFTEQKQLVCQWAKCNRLFELLQELVDHVNDFHVKPEKDAGYCCHWEGCARRGRGFNARYKMLIHIRTHTNERPHCCPTCHKSFSRLENLKIHNRSHTGEKPYMCPYEGCNKRYSNSSDRFKHTRTHYVDKPYYCKMPGCQKRYTDPSSLRKHIKAHGHFISHQQRQLLKIHQPPKLPATGDSNYTNGTQLIIPNPAAIFGSQSLPIPLTPGPLDLSSLACSSVASALAGLPNPMLTLAGSPLNLAKGSLLSQAYSAAGLGLPLISLVTSGKVENEKRPKGQRGDSSERTDGSKLRPGSIEGLSLLPRGVLDLSPGVGSESLLPGWVVIPPGSVLLKPAVVN